MSGFDRIARFYDPLERIAAGSILQQARTAHVDALAGRRSILSAGEGHGRFAALCAAAHPESRLTCVEASGLMIARARRRTGESANIEWIHAALPAWLPRHGAHDALVTCFFLDCFGPGLMPSVVDVLAGGASGRALWLNVDFAIPSHGIARWRASACLTLMHAFFRAACGIDARRLEPVAPHFARHGFRLVDEKHFSAGLVKSTLWHRG